MPEATYDFNEPYEREVIARYRTEGGDVEDLERLARYLYGDKAIDLCFTEESMRRYHGNYLINRLRYLLGLTHPMPDGEHRRKGYE